MMIRKVAGWTIIAAGTGLACLSGWLAYQGFETMIAIPFVGWIGPCVALSLIGLGVAVESEIRVRRWGSAAVLGLILISGAALDRHSGELALAEMVNAVSQENADRQAAFEEAVKEKSAAETLASDLAAELELMTSDRIEEAQLKLAGLGLYAGRIDGERGPITLKAMFDRGAEIRPQLATAREDVKAASAVVAAGVTVTEAPFTLHDAAIYATMVTALSIIFAFAGSYVANGEIRNVDQELDEMEEMVESFEAEVFDLAAFLASRDAA